MKVSLSKKPAKSAVPMHRFGINTVVLTEHKGLEAIRKRFKRAPDTAWAGGKGKTYMYQQLLSNLLAEDRYFDANPQQAVSSNPRWNDFMDDCVILAVLDAVLNGAPMELMHPDNWNQLVQHSKNQSTPSQRPVLLPGVPVIRSANH